MLRGGRPLVETIEDILSAVPIGSLAIIWDEPNSSPDEQMRTACELKAICHRYESIALIRERADIARASGCDGVHLDQTSVAPPHIRGWWPEALISMTCDIHHQVVKAAVDGANWAILGPIFGSDDQVLDSEGIGLGAIIAAFL